MPKKTLLSPLYFDAKITRRDDESRIVEGYCFVNEIVPGEGGIRLKRSAMEAATPDYEKWSNIREMHQPKAIGTARGEGVIDGEKVELGVQWDDKGCFIRCKVVDDEAWKKCQEGVLQAFSIGVRPTVVRGKDVESCTWFDTSLVDRPKDPDTPAFVRSEGTPVEVDDLEADVNDNIEDEVRGEFKKLIDQREPVTLRSAAIDALSTVLYNISFGWDVNRSADEKVKAAKVALKEFESYAIPLFERSVSIFDKEETETTRTVELKLIEAPDTITRSDELSISAEATAVEITDDMLAIARSTFERVQSTIGILVERLSKFDAKPKPVRFPEAFDSEKFKSHLRSLSGDDGIQELKKEYADLLTRGHDSTLTGNDRIALATKISEVKNKLSQLGEIV